MTRPRDLETEQLLRDGLGDVGARGGHLFGGRLDAHGGRLGARFAARLLPIRTHEGAAQFEAEPGSAAEIIADVFGHLGGRLVTGEIEPGSARVTLRGVIGAGALNMNPAVVDVELEPRPGGGSVATLHAAAKEGLIPQRTARKAVRRVLESYARAAGDGLGQSVAPSS